MYLAIFLSCAGTLFLEMLSTRVLGTVIGEVAVYYTIPVAVLGLGLGAALMAKLRRVSLPLVGWLCLGSSLATLLFFCITFVAVEYRNSILTDQLTRFGFERFLQSLVFSEGQISLGLGAILSIPYLCAGAAQACLFQYAKEKKSIAVLYGADLFGASAGALLSACAFSYGHYALALALAFALPALAATVLMTAQKIRQAVSASAVVLVAVAFVQSGAARFFEPYPHLANLARVYTTKEKATELWHTWKWNGRLSALKIESEEAPPRYVMALGQGEGHAAIPEFREGKATSYFPAQLATAVGNPKKILVLFAGAGRDMVALYQATRGNAEITGVEMNADVREWPLREARFGLEEFFKKPQIHYEISEARDFVEKTSERYDAILISWSGASFDYFTGAAGSSSRFLYTEEGLKRVLERLSPEGTLTILNGNKVKLLRTLFEILPQGSHKKDRYLVLGDPKTALADLFEASANNYLVVKPAGFTAEEKDNLQALARSYHFDVQYPSFDRRGAYELALNGARPLDHARLDFSPSTDDRPYSVSLFPRTAYFTKGFWQGISRHHRSEEGHWRWMHLMILLGCGVAGVTALMLSHPPKATSPDTTIYLILIGMGFMWVEIGVIQKLYLLLGNKGAALTIGLLCATAGAGLGSFYFGFSQRSSFSVGDCAGGGGVAIFFILLCFRFFEPASFYMPLALRYLFWAAVLSVPGFFLGQIFPRLIAPLNPLAAAWGFALNAVASGFAAGLAIHLTFLIGMQNVIALGGACYLSLWARELWRQQALSRKLVIS